MTTVEQAKDVLNQSIYEMLREGKSLEEIADSIELPLATIRGIYKRSVAKRIVIDNLQEAAKHQKTTTGQNGYLPMDYYNEFINGKEGYLKTNNIVHYYGTWVDALTEAGVMKPEKKWSKKDCIQAMQTYYQKEGKAPSASKWEVPSKTRPSYSYLIKLFGDIDNALEAAELPNNKKWRKITEEEIYGHMSAWTERRIPTRQEWDALAKNDHPNANFICSHLKTSWPNAWYLFATQPTKHKRQYSQNRKEQLLGTITDNPNLSIAELSKLTGTNNSYVSVLVKKLINEGKVIKDEKKQYTASISAAGL